MSGELPYNELGEEFDPCPEGENVERPLDSVPLDRAPLDIVPLDIDQLIREHHVDVYRYAFRLAGTQTDAEDLAQQTFLVAQQKLHQIRDPARARSWLFTIVRNCYLKQKRRPAAVSLDAGAEPVAQETRPPGGVALDWVDREWLQAALEQLSDEHKVILLMFYFEELSYREIAERLGVAPGTVMSRLARAKGRLRALLEREAGEAPSEANFPTTGLAV